MNLRTTRPSRASVSLAAAVAAVLTAHILQAAPQYFDTTNASGLTAGTVTWDAGTTAVWAGNASPGTAAPVVWVNGNDAFFQTGGNNTANVSGTVQVGSITITASGNSQTTTIGGTGTLELAGGITTSGGNQTNVISTTSLTLTGATSHAISLGRPLTLSSNIGESGGASSLSFSGNNAVTLSGTNTYSGGTTWAQNTLTVSNAAATNVLQGLGTGTLNLNGGQLNLRANGTGSNQQIITGNGTTGNNVIIGGNAIINSDRASGSNNTNTFVFNNLSIGANTLTTSSSNSYDLRFAGTTSLTGSATFDVQSGRNLTLGAAVDDAAGTFSVTKNGSGALLLTGANTFDGGISLNAGSLLIGNAGALGTGNLTIAAGTTINTTGGNQTLATNNTQTWNGNFSFSSSNNLTFGTGAITMGAAVTELRLTTGGSNTLTYNGAIGETNAGTGFTKFAGAGTVAFQGANSYTGVTTVTAGTLSIAGASGAITSSSSILLNGGRLLLDNSAANNNNRIAGNVSLVAGGELQLAGIGNTASTTEAFGQIGVGAGASTVTLSGTGAGQAVTLAADSLNRTNSGTLFVRGTSLGRQASDVGKVSLGTVPSGVNLVGAGGAAAGVGTIKNLGIIPWAMGNTSATGGLGNSAAGSFLTYDTTQGSLRALDLNNEYDTLSASYATTGNNVKQAAAAVALDAGGAHLQFVALYDEYFWNSHWSGWGSDSLTISSGAMAVQQNVNYTIDGFSSLIFGNGEAIIHGPSSNTLTISDAIDVTSGGGLTKTGAGVLEFGASNIYTGTTVINQGSIRFVSGNNNALNGTTGTDLRVNSGGTFNLNGTTQTVKSLTFTGTGTVSGTSSTLNLAGNVAYDAEGNLSGAAVSVANLNLNGARTFNVGDSNSLAATTGELVVSALIANGSSSGSIEKTGAGTLNLNSATSTFSGGVTITSGIVLMGQQSTGTATATSGTTTAGALGTGTLTLNGGTFNPNGKTIFNNMVASASTSSTIDLSGVDNSNFRGNLSGSGMITLQNSGGSASLKLFSGASQDWSAFIGTINYNGAGAGVTVNALNLLIDVGANGTFDLSNATLNFANPTNNTNSQLTTNNSSNQTIKIGSLAGSSGVLFNTGNAGTILSLGNAGNGTAVFSGQIQTGGGAGNVSLVKNGSNTQVLGGTNTYSGTTTINGGTLQYAKQVSLYNNTAASWTAANITVESAATLALNVGGTGEFTSANVDTIKLIGTATTGFKNGSILALDTTNAGGSFAYNTVIANTNAGNNSIGFTKLGTGILTTTAAHTYTGTTTVGGGTLQVSGSGTFGSVNSGLTVNTGGTADLAGTSQGVGALNGTGGTILNSTTSSASTLTVGNGNATGGSYAGVLANNAGSGGTVAFTKTGTGTQTLTGLNTYTGATGIQNGTLAGNTVGTGSTAQALGAGSTVNLGVAGTSSGTFSYTGTAAGTLDKNINALGNGGDTIQNSAAGTANLLTLAGTLTKNGTTLTLNGGTSGIKVTGQIVGASANSDLTITGGTTTVTNDNTYNGATVITSTGTLKIDNGGANAGQLSGTTGITVNNGGSLILGGTSAVNERINNSANLTLSGGTFGFEAGLHGATETMGSLTLNANSTLDFGTGTYGSELGNTLRFSALNLNTYTLSIYHWSGPYYAPGAPNDTGDNTQDRLLFATNGLNGQNLAQINFYSDGGSTLLGSGQQIIFGADVNYPTELAPIPEPGTIFGALALVGLVGCRERRRLGGILARLQRRS